MCKNKLFQSLGMKSEFHTKFKDKNSSLTKKLLYLKCSKCMVVVKASGCICGQVVRPCDCVRYNKMLKLCSFGY
jgi:hypothetical protein